MEYKPSELEVRIGKEIKAKEELNKMIDELKAGMAQATGTEGYYNHWANVVKYTDGVKFVADKARAYWLIDAIASYQKSKVLNGATFQIWELKIDKDQRAILTCKEDDPGDDIVRQEIPYTDFPFDIKIYCIDGIILLPS
jgi:hypothetical protein